MTEYFSAGQLLANTGRLLRLGAVPAAAAFIPLTGIGILVDSGIVDQSSGSAVNLLSSGISVAAAYWITKRLLEQRIGHPLPPRFPAFFGLGILSALAILLGGALLLIPGIVLFIRWSASSPILLSGERGVIEAMQESWRATGPHFWPILVAFLAFYGPCWGLAIAAYSLEDLMPTSIVPAIVANVAIDAALIGGWHMAVAIQALLVEPDLLAETFA